MKKLLCVLCLIAIMLVPFTFTASAEEGPVIAYICKNMAEEWFISESAALEARFLEEGASKVIILDCNMDQEKYINNLNNVVAQNVDAIIVCPPDATLAQITVDTCNAADIPVIAIDDPLYEEDGTTLMCPAVTLRAYDIGYCMGEWLAKYVVENGLDAKPEEVAYINLYPGDVSSCVPRARGAADAFLAGCALTEGQIIDASNSDGTTEKCYDIASAIIVANPQIKYWLGSCTNDEGAMGIVRALEAAGLSENACVVGCGAYLAKDEFQREGSCMKAAAYFSGESSGTLCVEEVMGLLKDGKVMCSENVEEGQTHGIVYFPSSMVDSENYVEIMGLDAE